MRFANRSLYLTLIIGLILLSALIASCNPVSITGRTNPDSSSHLVALPEGIPEEFQTLFEVYFTLSEEHLNRKQLDPKELSRGAIKGMLEALDDPYASYLEPDLFSVEFQRFKGFFEGIGAEVSLSDGKIIVVAPLPNTPAEKAGIRPGDAILAVDGETTEGMGLFQVVARIRGPRGTSVELLVLHRNESTPTSVTIMRGVIDVPTVNLRILAGGLAHLQISIFADSTNQELLEALDRVEQFNASGLILDLRNNPGGLVSATIDVTSQFLEGDIIAYQIDGHEKRTNWNVNSAGNIIDLPMILLVNEFSASSSEIMAGAFKDLDRATIVGTRTFGKGSVNLQYPLADGSGIYFTTAHWFTPNGTLIEGAGIEPDIIVLPDAEGLEDRQLDRAMELLEDILEGTE